MKAAVALLILVTGAASSRAAEPTMIAEVTEGPALPYGVASHAGGLVRQTPVIAAGGSWSADKKTKERHRETLIFTGGKWTPGPMLPRAISDCAYASDGASLFIAGGTDGKSTTTDVMRLSDVGPDAEWKKLPDLPEPVECAAGAIHRGIFYVVGGVSNGHSSNRMFGLDYSHANACWKSCAPLPAKGRAYAALLANGDFLYLFGGYAGPPAQEKDEFFGDAYRYDPATDKWEQLTGFNLPGFGWSAVSIDDSHVMLAGRIDERNKITDDVWLLDLRSPDKPARIGKLVNQSCCMTPVKVAPATWWFIAGEPDDQRTRTPRVSVVHLSN
jgi:N-acetylneuraminic acid mutarotase